MSYANYQNWGGILFRDAAPGEQANTVAFPYALSTITQTEEKNFSFYTNNGDKVESVKGIRCLINSTIIGRSTAEVSTLYNFFNMLNQKLNIGGLKHPFWMYPRYDSTKTVNDVYAVFLTSDVEPQNGSNSGTHQIFNFSFEGIYLQQGYSTNIDLAQNDATITIAGSQTDMTLTIASSTTDATIIGQKE